LPFVTSAHAAPDDWAAIDEACDLFLRGHVQNRASRDLGRGLLEAAGRALPAVAPQLAEARARGMAAHHAPAFGVVHATLGFDRDATQAAFLHGALRGLLSSAVRLGVIGPLEAQRVHAALVPTLAEIATRCGDLRAEDAMQTAPVLEVLAGTHDRLYTRLFQS
jgi:urease accessory protein